MRKINIAVKIGKLLAKNKMTLAVAESCTGGLISHKITNVPGSSAYFLLGVVAYSNEAKIKMLKIAPGIIKRHGAVSLETAVAMAAKVRKITGATLGLSSTGIAGPGGATPKKPVGLVFISLSYEEGSNSGNFLFRGNRLSVKNQASRTALDLLYGYLSAYKNRKI